MANILIKPVLIGGFLMFLISQVVAVFAKGLPDSNWTLLLAYVFIFLGPFIISKLSLEKFGKKAIINSFLQGIVFSVIVTIFRDGFSLSYLAISILGAVSGGYVISKKK
jgi:hypothetical protein